MWNRIHDIPLIDLKYYYLLRRRMQKRDSNFPFECCLWFFLTLPLRHSFFDGVYRFKLHHSHLKCHQKMGKDKFKKSARHAIHNSLYAGVRCSVVLYLFYFFVGFIFAVGKRYCSISSRKSAKLKYNKVQKAVSYPFNKMITHLIRA